MVGGAKSIEHSRNVVLLTHPGSRVVFLKPSTEFLGAANGHCRCTLLLLYTHCGPAVPGAPKDHITHFSSASHRPWQTDAADALCRP